MEVLSLYIWKSIVVSGLLTTWYLLGLRGKRLHQYNRFFLLSTLFLSLTIPLFHFQLFNLPAQVTGRLAPVAQFIQTEDNDSKAMSAAQQTVASQIDWIAIAGTAAAGISLVLLSILAIRILKVRKMLQQYPATEHDGVSVIQTDSPRTPFTFLKFVFWNKDIPLQGEIGQLIFRHEVAHIEQGHTYDKLACQVLTCIFWFNPFYWVIQKELDIVHEFVADEQAVGNRDTETFAKMVLQSYNNGNYLVPEHHFFSSTIKRRLTMLQNATRPSHASLRRFMALPLIAGTILLFSFGRNTGTTGRTEPAKKKIVVVLDAGHGGKDAGSQAGSYTEKEMCLKVAKRIQELSPAYNVEVKLTRDEDKSVELADRVAVSEKVKADMFISLHMESEPGTEKEKGDMGIYISSQNNYANQSSTYSTAIFQAMVQDGVIPGIENTNGHVHTATCGCNKTTQPKMAATEKDGVYVLKHATAPSMVMVLGNIKNEESMQQLNSGDKMDLVCKAVLKGVVAGVAEEQSFKDNGFKVIPDSNDPQKCR